MIPPLLTILNKFFVFHFALANESNPSTYKITTQHLFSALYWVSFSVKMNIKHRTCRQYYPINSHRRWRLNINSNPNRVNAEFYVSLSSLTILTTLKTLHKLLTLYYVFNLQQNVNCVDGLLHSQHMTINSRSSIDRHTYAKRHHPSFQTVDLERAVESSTTTTILYNKASDNNGNDNAPDNAPENKNENESTESDNENMKPKSKSRLAMAAEDWLDDYDDGEDELSKYWNNFEQNKNDNNNTQKKQTTVGATSTATTTNNKDLDTLLKDTNYMNLSTEQKLDQYYQNRGIDKELDAKYKPLIQSTIQSISKKASNAQEAIEILSQIKPYIQPNTKIGGEALLELCVAYISGRYDDDSVERKKDSSSNDTHNIDDVEEELENQIINIFELLKDNPHRDIQQRLKQMKKDPMRFKKEYGVESMNYWKNNGFWFFGKW